MHPHLYADLARTRSAELQHQAAVERRVRAAAGARTARSHSARLRTALHHLQQAVGAQLVAAGELLISRAAHPPAAGPGSGPSPHRGPRYRTAA